ncbi:MAG: glycosyltransferase family 2 protein [Bacillota bacterium]|nr:glycosyltransferase family 2 protein [Bacillota bacterium]
MAKVDLSVIIVNWNTRELLKDCIDSIYQNTQGDFDIFVVDNNSSDGSCEMLKEEFSDKNNLNIIENKDNKGFAAANNQAIRLSNANAVLLLNPDTIVHKNVIFECYNQLMGDEKLGVVGCKVLNPDGTLQLACRRMAPNPKDAFYKLLGISKLKKK